MCVTMKQHLVENDLQRPGLGDAGGRVDEAEERPAGEGAAALADVLAEVPQDHANVAPAVLRGLDLGLGRKLHLLLHLRPPPRPARPALASQL